MAHLLEVNTFRVHLENACRDLSWQLSFWLCPDELIPLMGDRQLIPDGYFRIARQVDGQTRQSAFFIETERVAKRSAVVKSKISRYLRFQQNGYHEAFGTRSLRVLFFSRRIRIRPRRYERMPPHYTPTSTVQHSYARLH